MLIKTGCSLLPPFLVVYLYEFICGVTVGTYVSLHNSILLYGMYVTGVNIT